jgi:hypothetical protein
MSSSNICLHSRFGMMFLFLDQVFGETLNTHPAPSIELCPPHVSLVFLHMFCGPAWLSSWGGWGGGGFSVLWWEENSIYDQGLYWFCFITRDHNIDRISRSWQIISYYVLNLADCIANFRNLDRKKRKAGRCKGDFFGRIGPKSPLMRGKNKVTKLLEES